MTSAIPTAVLGRTGLEVTRLGFGTALRSGLDDERWAELLNSVLDSGINFIDTANDYGLGWPSSAEEQIGRHISGRRSEFYLATKCGCPPGGGEHIWTRENAFRGLHESLERLQTDYVDVMQYHNPSVEECEAGDLVTVLEEMRQQGKVRWIGVSTTLPHQPTYLEWGVFDVFQIPYSALEREHEEWISRAAQAGTGMVVRGGVAQGRNEEEDGNAVAAAAGSAWTFPGRATAGAAAQREGGARRRHQDSLGRSLRTFCRCRLRLRGHHLPLRRKACRALHHH